MAVCDVTFNLQCIANKTDILNCIVLNSIAVYDTLDGKSVANSSILERVKGVRQLLDTIAATTEGGTVILIEQQPERFGPHSQSSGKSLPISHQICHVFCNTNRVEFIQPSLKGKFKWVDVAELKTKQATTKKQASANFKYIAKLLNWNISHIKGVVMDDAADAFMQAVAFAKLEIAKLC